jgi:general L-amino acid transport system permease protein
MTTPRKYVRTEDAPLLPPPATEAGITGWLWQNIFSSMADFQSIGAGVRSLFMILFSLLLVYVFIDQTYGLIDFAILSAVWSDPEGLKREACWPFVWAKQKFAWFGPYPSEELWRIYLALAVGSVGLVWALLERMPYHRQVGVLMLTIYPLLAFILLTGGNSDASLAGIGVWIIAGLALISVGRMGAAGHLGTVFAELASIFGIVGWGIIALNVVRGVAAVDFNLTPVGTGDWGGLLITLVVALTGIVASLPLGIILALGRRSQMPVVSILCTIFIEFWRGVPLITVLFMASVMLPLFLPAGVNFDNLLRALIGVMLFSAAYMAEVVRGGLQAIDKGQYEGAQAMGLSYWQTMRLIILPQALTHVIPGIVNTFIGLFKDTTLVSIVGIFDLLGAGQSAISDAAWSTPVQAITMYLYVGVIFFIFCFGMSRYSIFMENKLSKSRRH